MVLIEECAIIEICRLEDKEQKQIQELRMEMSEKQWAVAESLRTRKLNR